MITLDISKSIKQVSENLIKLVSSIGGLAENCINGRNTLFISSGENFKTDWIIFKSEIKKNLENLNIAVKAKEINENGKMDIVTEALNENLIALVKTMENSLTTKIKGFMSKLAKTELEDIMANLKGENFFNLSGNPIDPEVIYNLKKGKKFTPFSPINIKKELRKFEEEIIMILNNIFGNEAKNIKTQNLFIKIRKLKKTGLIRKNQHLCELLLSIEKRCKTETQNFKKHIKKIKNKQKQNKLETDLEQVFNLNKGQILVAADKNMGYVCIDTEDLLQQYEEINKKQHFGKINIREEWYLRNLNFFLKEASEHIPTELTEIIKKSDFIWKGKNQEIGTLRLMPKIQKLKIINKANVSNLTCRGIKSSMNDPINLIQKILDKVYSHLLYYIEIEFTRLFGKLSPSVTGIDEPIARVKSSKTGEWGKSIEIEGDFGDLYSNCNKDLLESCLKTAGKICKLETESIMYILNLMKVSMTHSYFKQPKGIYKTLKGFSMGDNSAARGSEIILRIYELKIFEKIHGLKLEKNVSRFLRFRDDVSVHLTGEIDPMLKALKIITTGYPKCIQFNVETKIIYGKFLNIKIFNLPGIIFPTTTVLRKDKSKFDIIPFNSNVSMKYKKMAGLGYFRTVKTHTCSNEEYINQSNIVKAILKEKGFPQELINKLEKPERKTTDTKVKKFIGTTVFDKVSNRHIYVKQIFRKSILNKDTHYLPTDVPGKKLEQYIFTIKKMRNKLNF